MFGVVFYEDFISVFRARKNDWLGGMCCKAVFEYDRFLFYYEISCLFLDPIQLKLRVSLPRSLAQGKIL